MSTTTPIREKDDIERLKNYFYNKKEYRNYLLVIIGLNTALRISDVLQLKWTDVYHEENQCFYKHIILKEQKTQKETMIPINQSIQNGLKEYRHYENPRKSDYLFYSRKDHSRPIGREQAYRIIKNASLQLEITGHISCHSLRKTFGYQAWKTGAEPALLMSIYNHSSYGITKRYLGIEQDDKDQLFLHNAL